MSDNMLEPYLSGNRLYGDDLVGEALEQWFKDEEKSYFELVSSNPHVSGGNGYGYHAFNRMHGFKWLPAGRYPRALGIGSASGDEFLPVTDRIDSLTILEPADGFVNERIGNLPVRYVKPVASGDLFFADGEFDLVTCFGALHHIPNISKVMSEMARCTRPGGYALVREPIISMGDWSRPRKGLTKHERGIPLKIFREIINQAGYEIIRETKCMFPAVYHLGRLMATPAYNSRILTHLDALLSLLTGLNETYHRKTALSKIGPVSVFYVLRRTG